MDKKDIITGKIYIIKMEVNPNIVMEQIQTKKRNKKTRQKNIKMEVINILIIMMYLKIMIM